MEKEPIEDLRAIWSPDQEVEEVIADLSPGTELDSMIRDFLFRICDQKGPQTVILGMGDIPKLNEGTLRWEIIHHAPQRGLLGKREVTLWVEKQEDS